MTDNLKLLTELEALEKNTFHSARHAAANGEAWLQAYERLRMSVPKLIRAIRKLDEALEKIETMDDVSCSGDAVVNYCGKQAKTARAEVRQILGEGE